MRIATVRDGRRYRLAVVFGDEAWFVEDLNRLLPQERVLPESAIPFIEAYQDDAASIQDAVETARRKSPGYPLAELALAPPVPTARKLLCVAGNYAEHVAESGGQRPERSEKLPPRVFMKPPSTTMIGSGQAVRLPKTARAVDWEIELGVVVGRAASYVEPGAAAQYIFGYTIVNDISERDFDPGERSRSRAGDEWFDWLNGKWHDTFAPVGPVVVTADELSDPQSLRLRLEVNGRVEQEASTSLMLHDVYSLVSFFSRIMTLEPGDIIATGTPAGVGDAKGRYLKPGDVITASIEGIGTLTNPVVAYAPTGGSDE